MLNKTINSPLNYSKKNLYSTPDSVTFGGFSLSSRCNNWEYWISIINNPLWGMSDIQLSEFSYWLEDGWWITSREYTWRDLELILNVEGETYTDLLRRIDEIKKWTSGIEEELTIKVWEQYRTTTATLNKWSIEWLEYGVTDVTITLWFKILQPHFYLKDSTSYVFPDITSKIYSESIYNDWTGDTKPVIALAFKPTGNSGITQIEISTKRLWESESYTAIYNGSVTNSDLIVFDFWLLQVFKNADSSWWFGGVMDRFYPEANVFEINIVWTSVDYEASIVYNEVYK